MARQSCTDMRSGPGAKPTPSLPPCRPFIGSLLHPVHGSARTYFCARIIDSFITGLENRVLLESNTFVFFFFCGRPILVIMSMISGPRTGFHPARPQSPDMQQRSGVEFSWWTEQEVQDNCVVDIYKRESWGEWSWHVKPNLHSSAATVPLLNHALWEYRKGLGFFILFLNFYRWVFFYTMSWSVWWVQSWVAKKHPGLHVGYRPPRDNYIYDNPHNQVSTRNFT